MTYFSFIILITFRHPDLPCVHLGRESYVPIELCSTEPKNKKKLSDKETADMIRHTAVPAFKRKEQIMRWVEQSEVSKDPILKTYNITVEMRMTQLDGRVLPGPDITYGKNKTITSKEIGEKGAWDHRNSSFMNPMGVVNWAVLNLAGPRLSQGVEKLIDMFINGKKKHEKKILKNFF